MNSDDQAMRHMRNRRWRRRVGPLKGIGVGGLVCACWSDSQYMGSLVRIIGKHMQRDQELDCEDILITL